MKRVDESEFYKGKESNSFAEFKNFPAERYFSSEIAPFPKEEIKLEESFAESEIKKTEDSSSPDLEKIKKETERFSKEQVEEESVSSSASSNVTSVVSTTAAGAATGAIAVTVILASLYPFIGQHLQFSTGPDYALLSLDTNEILQGNADFSTLNASDFYLEFETDCFPKKVTLEEGENTYLFTGFSPNTSYKYNVICSALSDSDTTCYSDKITTGSSYSSPAVAFDNRSTYFSFSDDEETFRLNYNLYVSDFNHSYRDYRVYLCGSKPSEEGQIQDVFFSSNDVDGSFLKGISDYFDLSSLYRLASGLETSVLYLCLTGEQDSGVLSSTSLLSTQEIAIEFPSTWSEPILIVGETDEDVNVSSSEVSISKEFIYADEKRDFEVSVCQYNDDLMPLSEANASSFSLDLDEKRYTIGFDAAYGLKKFKYCINTKEEDGTATQVYESSLISYDEDQSYDASFKVIDPSEATITYENGVATILVDPSFESKHGNLYYILKLVSGDEVLDVYKGTGVAEFRVPVEKLSSSMRFIYEEAGNFNGEEVSYQSESTDDFTFGYPSFSFGDEVLFEDESFALPYSFQMPFDYSKATLEFYLDDGNEIKKYSVSPTEDLNSRLLLSDIEGELGDVSVTAELTFFDNQTAQKEHTLTLGQKHYDLSYQFSVSNVLIDLANSDGSTFPTTLYLNRSILPNEYQIRVYVNDTVVIEPTSFSDEVEVPNVPYDTSNTLKIEVLDSSSSVYKSVSYDILYAQAKSQYSTPTTYETPIPDDSLVTYNEDGTINLYRKICYSSTGDGACFNASVVASPLSYPCISDGDYAVLTHITSANYHFVYYNCVKVEGVTFQYELMLDTSSNSEAELMSKTTTAKASVTLDDSSAKITVNLTDGHFVGNRVLVDGTSYEFDEEPGLDSDSATLTIPDLKEVNSVLVYASPYYKNYESYSKDIEIEGNPSLEVEAEVSIASG